ncbi:response regulator transcription factor [Gorillibacterium sp. sgz5001074]|uniref:response regulator transcription factor n=1 Tax=Gorillibacterium sp. sgz5001074 TaxID=3446695 RepID=UPI003F667336
MTRITTALVVEDHPLMAQASKNLLEQIEGVVIAGIAYTGEECMALAEQYKPDLVFLDYQLPDMTGTDVSKQLKARYPDIRIIIFTGVDVSDLASTLVELQVHGVISKGTNHTSIHHLIQCVLENYHVLPSSIMDRLNHNSGTQPVPHGELTEDEITIMKLLIRGDTIEQIADAIHVSKRSVDNYQKRIYGKLGVKNKVQALEAFIQSKYYSEHGQGGNGSWTPE